MRRTAGLRLSFWGGCLVASALLVGCGTQTATDPGAASASQVASPLPDAAELPDTTEPPAAEPADDQLDAQQLRRLLVTRARAAENASTCTPSEVEARLEGFDAALGGCPATACG